jgi:hypothetical protein
LTSNAATACVRNEGRCCEIRKVKELREHVEIATTEITTRSAVRVTSSGNGVSKSGISARRSHRYSDEQILIAMSHMSAKVKNRKETRTREKPHHLERKELEARYKPFLRVVLRRAVARRSGLQDG